MRRALLVAAAAVLLAGCGEIGNTIRPQPGTADTLTVALDSAPNPTHAGIYLARADGYFAQTDLNVHLLPPAGTSPLRALESGRAQVAILTEPEVLLARNTFHPLVSIAALVQGPAAVTVVCRTPSSRRGSRRPLAPRCTARQGTPDPAYAGAPTYNGLVFAVLEKTIVNHAPVLRRFIQAVGRGYAAARADPAAAAAALPIPTSTSWNTRIGTQAVALSLMGQFAPGHGFGWQDNTDWNAFGEWLHTHHELSNPNAIPGAETNELLPGQGV
jgi:ABC-type nitrate/sulfonate/bicarbonate transport system substrate-binding protein